MPSAQQLTEILNAALQKLWQEDYDLFVNDEGRERTIHERTVVARLLHHLICVSCHYSEYITNNLSWDFEYNRQSTNNNVKQIEVNTENNDLTKLKRVFPDLILHQRNQTNNNCCVIEVKCTSSSSFKAEYIRKDYESLIGLLNTHHYHFAISLLISFQKAYLTWFTNDSITEPCTLISALESSEESSCNFSLASHPKIYHNAKIPPKAFKAFETLTLERNIP